MHIERYIRPVKIIGRGDQEIVADGGKTEGWVKVQKGKDDLEIKVLENSAGGSATVQVRDRFSKKFPTNSEGIFRTITINRGGTWNDGNAPKDPAIKAK